MSHSVLESKKDIRRIYLDTKWKAQGRSVKGEVLRNYEGTSFFTRLFLKMRWRFTPYAEIAAHVPARGLIYDLGCGHGLLSLTLALQSQGRIVYGVDHDEKRIRLARQAAQNFLNLDFQEGNLTQVLTQKWNHAAAIVVMDAMHYLAPKEQERLLEQARVALVPGGWFLMREVDTTAGMTSRINKVHEWAMTGIGFTKAERVNYRTPDQWNEVFRKTGFSVQSKPCGCFPFADRLFICQKA